MLFDFPKSKHLCPLILLVVAINAPTIVFSLNTEYSIVSNSNVINLMTYPLFINNNQIVYKLYLGEPSATQFNGDFSLTFFSLNCRFVFPKIEKPRK